MMSCKIAKHPLAKPNLNSDGIKKTSNDTPKINRTNNTHLTQLLLLLIK